MVNRKERCGLVVPAYRSGLDRSAAANAIGVTPTRLVDRRIGPSSLWVAGVEWLCE